MPEPAKKKKKSRARKKSGLPSRVYRGALQPPVEGVEQVNDQLFKAHCYYNDLTSISRGEIDAKKALQLKTPVGPQLVEAEARVLALYKERDKVRAEISAERQERRKDVPASLENRRRLVDLKAEILEAQDVRAGWRKKANLDPAYKALVKGIGPRRKDLVNVHPKTPGMGPGIRGQCGLYSGTYLRTENAANAAHDHAMQFWASPRYHRWQGDGAVAVQVSGGGIPVSKLYGKQDTRIQIIDEVRTRITKRYPDGREIPGSCWLRLRTGSLKGKPIWTTWPMSMHRPLPPDAIVKWVTVIRRRIGPNDATWEVHFSLEAKSFLPREFDEASPQLAHLPKKDAPPVAVHFHPMAVGDENGNLLVAMAIDSTGQTTPCTLTMVDRHRSPRGEKSTETMRIQDVKGAQEHANGLQAQRDTNFDEIRHTLRAEMDVRDVPEWLTEALHYMAQWKQQVKLAKVALRWREERFDGDENMYNVLDAWRRQDKHLYQWEAHEREKAIRHRQAIYRSWARKLATKHPGMLVIENINLANLARRANPEDEDPLHDELRSRRPSVAVGELREALKHAFFGRVTILEPTGRAALCPICSGALKGNVDDRECRRCDTLPTVWFGRCWQLLRDAGHSVDAIETKWQSDMQMMRQMNQLKEAAAW